MLGSVSYKFWMILYEHNLPQIRTVYFEFEPGNAIWVGFAAGVILFVAAAAVFCENAARSTDENADDDNIMYQAPLSAAAYKSNSNGVYI